MKNYIMSLALAAVSVMPAFSAVEEQEIMIVKLADGNTAEFSIESVESVSFGVREIRRDMVITDADGTETVYPEISPLYRMVSQADGAAVQFGFGTGTSSVPEEVPLNSEWGLVLTIAQSELYTTGMNLATDKDCYAMRLMRYEDGGVIEEYTTVTSGTLTTAMDMKSRKVTIDLDAYFEDGPQVTADFTILPVDVESLTGMIPAHKYDNEVFYYNNEGKLTTHAMIGSVSKSGSDPVQFTFKYADNAYINGDTEGRIYLGKSLIDSVPVGTKKTFNLAEGADMRVMFGVIQLAAYPEDNARYMYSNIADNGEFTFGVDADGTYHFLLDVVNTYTLDMGYGVNPGGTPERIVLNYSGKID